MTHVLPYAESHAREAAYETCTDLSIELFRRWRRKAEEAGVDMSRYFQVLWKYSKTPEEKKIVQFVEQMKTEATGRGIYLDLKKLLALDVSWLEEVQEVFEEAREVAAEHGMELRLPEVVLKGERRCEFIEEGGAFVSWEGGVHPCYFLWHRYNCFASGWTQMVQPKVFGNLSEQGYPGHLEFGDGFREFPRERPRLRLPLLRRLQPRPLRLRADRGLRAGLPHQQASPAAAACGARGSSSVFGEVG